MHTSKFKYLHRKMHRIQKREKIVSDNHGKHHHTVLPGNWDLHRFKDHHQDRLHEIPWKRKLLHLIFRAMSSNQQMQQQHYNYKWDSKHFLSRGSVATWPQYECKHWGGTCHDSSCLNFEICWHLFPWLRKSLTQSWQVLRKRTEIK